VVAIFLIPAIICSILIVLFSVSIVKRLCRGVQHVHHFTFIQEDTVEKFRGMWTPSPSSFVEKHNLVYQFVGEGEVVGPDLPSSAIEAVVMFADGDVGKSGSAWVRTTGDNGTVDNCNKVGFTVNNLAQVKPVEGFLFEWVEHVV
jgi:hypothetical protein